MRARKVSRAGDEAALAEDLYDHRDDEQAWGEWEPVAPGRLDVTLSVRFSQEEIAQIRAAAEAAHLKPTAFIREAALSASSSGLVGGRELRKALDSVRAAMRAVDRLTLVSAPAPADSKSPGPRVPRPPK